MIILKNLYIFSDKSLYQFNLNYFFNVYNFSYPIKDVLIYNDNMFFKDFNYKIKKYKQKI